MSTVPCANYRRTFTTERIVGDKVDKITYELNTTARKVDSMTIVEYSALIIKTTKLWLYIAKAIENGQRELPETIAFKSAEMSTEDETKTELQQFGESRVTIFDWNHQLELTLHSNSLPQPTLEIWWAMNDAQKELETLYPRNPKNASQSSSTGPNSSSMHPQATTIPKALENAQNTANSVFYTKKDAIAKLLPGSPFKWRVAQIEKHSKDGKDFYEFFEFWDGKAGQYSGSSVFTDNEIAINSGLIAYLDSLGIKAGQALSGDWITNATVGKPKTKTVKGEEKTFTNIYVNSFEGQPEKV